MDNSSEILWMSAIKWAVHQEDDKAVIESMIKSFERNLNFCSSDFLKKIKEEVQDACSTYHLNLELWKSFIFVLSARLEALKPENLKAIYLGGKKHLKAEPKILIATNKKAQPWQPKALKCGKYTLIGMHAVRVNK